MAFSRVVLNYTGSNTFAVNFTLGYISPDHVTARVNDEVDGSQQPVYRTLTWLTEGTVSVGGVLEDGDVVTFERTTPKDELTNVYLDGDILDDENIDDSFKQAIMIAHEVLDGRLGVLGDNIDMGTNRITNLGEPVDAQDAATKNYIDTFEALNTATIIAARDKAEQWAEEDEDVEVETGQYSSKHHALKSAASATASATSETNAAASALAASAALESSFMSDSITITNADSPFTLTTTHVGNFVNVDTSGGDVIINIDPNLVEPYAVRIKKGTSDASTVTINTQATETFSDATTTKTIEAVGGLDLTLNTDTSPDTWEFAGFGAAAGEPKKQLFNAGTDYTKGATTLTLTNTPIAPSSTALTVSYDGVNQHSDQWSYDPGTGVFTDSAGIQADSVQFRWEASSVAIGVTADGSVSFVKLASGLVANLTQLVAGTASKLVDAAGLKSWKEQEIDPKLLPAGTDNIIVSNCGYSGGLTVNTSIGCTVTRISTGIYRYTFDTAMSSTNYSIFGHGYRGGANYQIMTGTGSYPVKTTTYCEVRFGFVSTVSGATTSQDPANFDVMIVGEKA